MLHKNPNALIDPRDPQRLTITGRIAAGLALSATVLGLNYLASHSGKEHQSSANFTPSAEQKAVAVTSPNLPADPKDMSKAQYHFKAVDKDNPAKLAQELTNNSRDEAKMAEELQAEQIDGFIQPSQSLHVDQDLVHADPGTRFNHDGQHPEGQ